jgi:hypothetical protein
LTLQADPFYRVRSFRKSSIPYGVRMDTGLKKIVDEANMRNLIGMKKCLFVLLLLAFGGYPVISQSFPTRSIIVVPFVSGDSADVTARVIADPMAAALDKNVVVENIGGGSALFGTGRVARAASEGYALLVHRMMAISENVSLFAKSPVNVKEDLVGVGLINSARILTGRRSLIWLPR